MRVLLFTGKGGVGKTTTAAATAVRLARDGARVLVTSTDPAHSLADVLEARLGDEPTAVAPNLDAEQVDTRCRLERGWGEIRTYLTSLLQWGGANALQAAELAVLPGLEELVGLLDIQHHAQADAYDVVVVDCGATAETIRLLSLPDVLGWYIERLLPLQRRVTRALRPTLERLSDLPVPKDRVFGAVERLYHHLVRTRALLLDPAITSVRLVLNPEAVVLAEAKRTYTLLCLFGYQVDAVIVNRILDHPDASTFLGRWHERQQTQLAAIARAFGELAGYAVPHYSDEVAGVTALGRLGDDLYRGRDPQAVLSSGPQLELADLGGGHELRLPLPLACRDDVVVFQHQEELHVRIGSYTRTLVLPASLKGVPVHAARLDRGWLTVRFAAQPTAGSDGG